MSISGTPFVHAKPLHFISNPVPKEVQMYHVRYLRDRFELSQKQLADLLGLSEQSIRGWENGAPIGAPSRKLITLMLNNPEVFKLTEKKPAKV